MRILVTGAAGFIGSNMSEKLLSLGVKVVGIDNFSTGKIGNLPKKKNFTFYKADLRNKEALDIIFSQHDFDVVMHIAGNASIVNAFTDPQSDVENNTIATMNITNLCMEHKIPRLLYASTMVVYGKNNVQKSEKSSCVPVSTYGITKYAAERYVMNAGDRTDLRFDFNTTAFRMFNCYSDDTEILTKVGFKYLKDLKKQDLVATLNENTNTLEYHKPLNFFKIKNNEDMYRFKSTSYDMLVTGEHPMLIMDRKKKRPFSRVEAREIYNNQNKYYDSIISRQPIEYDADNNKKYVISKCSKYGDEGNDTKDISVDYGDWMKFLGWYISEGCCFETGRRRSVVISQCKDKNPKNHKEICDLVKKMGFSPYVTDREIQINSKQLYLEIKKLFPSSGAKNKCIPRKFLDSGKKCLENLYDSLMKGDGTKCKEGYRRYSTNSKNLSDDMCELMFKLGIPSSIREEKSGENSIYRVDINKKRNFPQLGNNKSKKVYVTKEKYEGYVYDITVPNHIMYLRRNGKCFWGSNCYGPNQDLYNPYQGVVAIFIGKFMRRQDITIHGNGRQTRDFIHVDDVTNAWISSINNKKTFGEVFNLGSGVDTSIKDILFAVKNRFENYSVWPTTIEYLETRQGDIKRCVANCDKIKKAIRWKPKIKLQDGLDKLFTSLGR